MTEANLLAIAVGIADDRRARLARARANDNEDLAMPSGGRKAARFRLLDTAVRPLSPANPMTSRCSDVKRKDGREPSAANDDGLPPRKFQH